jgi:hypothetical protein
VCLVVEAGHHIDVLSVLIWCDSRADSIVWMGEDVGAAVHYINDPLFKCAFSTRKMLLSHAVSSCILP